MCWAARPGPVLEGLTDPRPDRAIDPFAIWSGHLRDLCDFTVTGEHLKLLSHMHIRWMGMDYGAPAVCPTRPYGNSNITQDIAEILDLDLGEDYWEGGPMRRADQEKIARLHAETALALQILLATGQNRSGRFKRPNEYSDGWFPADPECTVT